MNWMQRLVMALAGSMPALLFAAGDCADLYETARKTRSTEASSAAYRSCRELAGKGDLSGRYLVGLLTMEGIGTPADAAAGLALVRAAAERGHAPAQARLGRFHLRGDVVERDPAKAAEWFTKAALSGDPLAQYELGQLHYTGQGVAEDPFEAYKWFTAAAGAYEQLGNVPRMKLAQRKRTTLSARLADAERSRAERWLKEHLKR